MSESGGGWRGWSVGDGWRRLRANAQHLWERSDLPRHAIDLHHRGLRLFGRRWLWAAYALSAILLPLLLLALLGAYATVLRTIFGAESNLGTGALIVALLGAPILLWRTVLAQRTLNFQKENLMTDRIAKAVEQLGAEKTVKVLDGEGKTQERTEPNLEVRLGGILALERIAQDSVAYDGGRDHVRVMEILCAYVRHNAPAPHPLPEDEEYGEEGEEYLSPPRADIAMAMRVIGRRSKEQRDVEARWGTKADPEATWPFDEPAPELEEGADLVEFQMVFDSWTKRFSGYHGYRLDLTGVNLRATDLKGSDFGGAQLANSLLDGADLTNTNLAGAQLVRASIRRSKLHSTNFEGAALNGAKLSTAELFETRLTFADLSFANLSGSRVSRALIRRTKLLPVSLDKSSIRDTNLNDSPIQGCFKGAKINNCILKIIGVNESKFIGAFLYNSDLSATNLPISVISRAFFGDASVKLPNGVAPGHPEWPRHWPTWTHENSSSTLHEWKEWRADPSAYRPPAMPPKLTLD